VVDARAVAVPPVLLRVAQPLPAEPVLDAFDAHPLLPLPDVEPADAHPLFPLPPAGLELAVAQALLVPPPDALKSPPPSQPPFPDDPWLVTVSRTFSAVVAPLEAPLSAPCTPIAAFMSIIDCAPAGAAARRPSIPRNDAVPTRSLIPVS
jgi:hypothetical protein